MALRKRAQKDDIPDAPAPEKSRKTTENLKERLEAFYGQDDDELIRAIKLRNKWGSTVFSLSKQMMDEQMELNEPIYANTENCGKLHSSCLSRLDNNAKGRSAPQLYECVVNDYLLKPHETRSSEVSTILNVGGSVLSIDWNATYIAVGVLSSQKPLNVNATSDVKSEKTLLLIYTFDNGKVQHRKTIYSLSGSCTSVKWRPSTNELLIICGTAVGIVDISAAPDGESVMEFKDIQSDLSRDLGVPTCASWKTPNAVVIGYYNGHIAELQVSNSRSNTVEVNYVLEAHDSAVDKISSAYPLFPNVVMSSGVEGLLVAYDTSDIRNRFASSRMKFHSSICFFSLLSDSFIASQDYDIARLFPARNPFGEISVSGLTKHDSCGITAGAASPNHPLIISGSQDGSVKISNVIRRTTVTSRKSRDTHAECCVWRLEASEHDGKYRYVDILRSDQNKVTKTTVQMPIYPNSVSITSCAWCPNDTWFAAGSASGLIRFDNVDA